MATMTNTHCPQRTGRGCRDHVQHLLHRRRPGSTRLSRIRHPRSGRPFHLRGSLPPALVRTPAQRRRTHAASSGAWRKNASSTHRFSIACSSCPKHVPPMDMLRTIVSALSYYDPEYNKNDHDANINKAIRLTSQISMIVADYDRIRKGKPVVEPDRSLSHAANFLLLLNGVAPSNTAERALRHRAHSARRS